ncbi:MAG: diguanylate cyclase [Desulfuromonadaceae bacterium]|nr:diguanylate cyclase [Desulfuromonadaceae bacterium]
MNFLAILFSPCAERLPLLESRILATNQFQRCVTTPDPGQVVPLCRQQDDVVFFYDCLSAHSAICHWRHQLDGEPPLQQHIPVIACSRHDDHDSKIAALESGANDFLSFEQCVEEWQVRIRLQQRFARRLNQLNRDQYKLAHQAMVDPLTNIYNRVTFDAMLDAELARYERSRKIFSLMLLDLDHFKRVNDRYGHPYGDRVLQSVASGLQKGLRSSDILCRFGGEEFAILLPETTSPHAYLLARRLHKQVGRCQQNFPELEQDLTISIGISSSNRLNILLPSPLIEQADQALYRAKQRGRNRTELYFGLRPLSLAESPMYSMC